MWSLSDWTVGIILNFLHITKYDNSIRERVKYSLRVIAGESFKMTGLIILFLILGKLTAFLVALLTITPLRTFIGGMHMKTKLGCFGFSLMFYSAIVFASEYIPNNGIYIHI